MQDTKNEEIQPYEKLHIDFLKDNSAECTLFLNRNDAFPLSSPCKLLLIGSGARQTLKGGTGSGEVESRYYTTCEQGLESAGFEIVSKDWLDKFPQFKKAKRQSFVNLQKELAESYKGDVCEFQTGAAQPEAEYDLPLEYQADASIYVISRLSGENSDRRLIKGDIYLTDSEIRDILLLNEKYEKFMLVLNVVGPVDLTPVKNVKNILLLSQLGVVTGDILADIVLGKANPSGKLATTWSAIKDYRYIDEFGGFNNTRYIEGLYVGYRFFDSFQVKPLYPFGFGLSYTDFSINKKSLSNKKSEITIDVEVKNDGKYDGKEVVQVYVSPSQENKDKPYQSLVAFKKTPVIKPNEKANLSLSFRLEDIARYDEENAQYILDKGNYIIRVGNCSNKTEVYGYISLGENIITQKLKNVGGKADFPPLTPEIKINDDLTSAQKIELTKDDFEYIQINYDYKSKINEKVKNFSNEELCKLSLGKFVDNIKDDTIYQYLGTAGETCQSIKEIDKFLILVDGPAGIRVAQKYGIDEKGKYRLSENVFVRDMKDFMDPQEYAKTDMPDNNKDRKGKIYYCNFTAIPVATALAQTFNEEFLEKIAKDVVGEEMDSFKFQVWLAPALNIHRNILCGRNFEYFSEDPLISGKMAAALSRGVQTHKNRAVTIKHFTCNNQELNRKNSNSILSERVLREIYLKGFQIAIKEGKPHCLMTSYNLINGEHASQRRDLIIDVLRCEWGFDGLIMSDWYESEDIPNKVSYYPSQMASFNIKAGNDLQMWGRKRDYEVVMQAVKDGVVTRDDLLETASRVYNTIELLTQ
jgi:beta-glucosidase